MARRMPRSGKERRTTVTEHIEVTGEQLHRAVPLEQCRLAVGKRPVDLSLLDQQRGIRKKVDIPHVVAVRREMATKAMSDGSRLSSPSWDISFFARVAWPTGVSTGRSATASG